MQHNDAHMETLQPEGDPLSNQIVAELMRNGGCECAAEAKQPGLSERRIERWLEEHTSCPDIVSDSDGAAQGLGLS